MLSAAFRVAVAPQPGVFYADDVVRGRRCGGVDRFGHGAFEILHAERLAKDRKGLIDLAQHPGVAADQQHGKLRTPLAQRAPQAEAVHRAAQHHVGDHHRIAFLALQRGQGGLGAADGGDARAQEFDQARRDLDHVRVVVDDEDRAVQPDRAFRGRRGLPLAALGPRQIEGDGGPAARDAARARRPARLAREAVDLAEPQSRALVGLFRREEGIEDLGQDVLGDAHPGVGQAEGHELADQIGVRIARLQDDVLAGDGEVAAIGHGVSRVDRQVDQGQLELVGVHLDRPQVGRKRDRQPAAIAQRLGQDVPERLDAAGGVDDGPAERLAPGERQQLAGERRAAGGRGLDHRRSLPDLGLAGGCPLEQLRLPPDDHQKVVEVVRDAAGELAQRLQLLAVEQAFLGPVQLQLGVAPFGAVAGDLRKPRQAAAGVR